MEALKELGIDPKVMAAQVTGFILLWIVLARYLFRPVLAFLDERQRQIKLAIDNANEERAKAEQLRAEFEQRMAGIEAEARSRVQAAVREANAAKEEILAEARSRAESILQRGQEDLAREREKILAQLREEVVNISLTAAGKVIGEALDEERHRKLVSDFIEKLEAKK
ncbi:MAG: F0F1 ATP synthase subunit B [Armatimonadetes bacterium]|nr:F0F1 ATP synthase subunit B [Armatimonadota bacterium]